MCVRVRACTRAIKVVFLLYVVCVFVHACDELEESNSRVCVHVVCVRVCVCLFTRVMNWRKAIHVRTKCAPRYGPTGP